MLYCSQTRCMKPISWGDKIWHEDRLHGGPCVWVCVCKWRGDEKACIIVNGLIFSVCGQAFCEEMNCFILQPHVSFSSFIGPYLVFRNMAVHVLSVSLHGFLHSPTFSLSSLICIFVLNCLCCRIEPVKCTRTALSRHRFWFQGCSSVSTLILICVIVVN